MSIAVNFYNNASDENVYPKKYSNLGANGAVLTKNCEITSEFDIDEIELLLDHFSNFHLANYAYIAEYGRYYFVTPRVQNGNQVLMHLISDPLQSFYGSYAGSPCVAERSSSAGNLDLPDELYPFKSQPKYTFRELGTAFEPSSSGGCYILTIGGK